MRNNVLLLGTLPLCGAIIAIGATVGWLEGDKGLAVAGYAEAGWSFWVAFRRLRFVLRTRHDGSHSKSG